MMFSVDPLRRSSRVSRGRKTDDETDRANLTQETEVSLLPVPVGSARTIHSGTGRMGGSSALHAQMIGERRGLRAGPNVHGLAAGSYNRTEWSGSYDRRKPLGCSAKTEI